MEGEGEESDEKEKDLEGTMVCGIREGQNPFVNL